MQQKKAYEKPRITRIKLQAGEAIMGTCQSTTQRDVLVKSSTTKTCSSAAGTNCRNAVS